jgi:hypothetical protein
VALPPTQTIIPYSSVPIPFGSIEYPTFGVNPSDKEEVANWTTPRVAILQNLQINVVVNSLVAPTEFLVRASTGIGPFVDTALLIDVPAGAVGLFNVSVPFKINTGDRVSLRVTTGGLAGEITFTGGLDVS